MRKILFIIAFLTIMMPSKAQKWLTHVDYDDHQTGLHMGYTSQQFKFYSGDYYFVSDGIWGDKNRLHGFDIGVVVQGNWGYGIGLYWALHTEFYFSTNNPTETYHATSVNGAYDFYGEFTFQMPLHLALKIPLTDDFALGFHTGPGITLTYISMFNDFRGYFDDWSGLGDQLNVINLTYDFALYLEFNKIRLESQWSYGFTNNKNYASGLDRVVRNKFTIGLTIFGD